MRVLAHSSLLFTTRNAVTNPPETAPHHPTPDSCPTAIPLHNRNAPVRLQIAATVMPRFPSILSAILFCFYPGKSRVAVQFLEDRSRVYFLHLCAARAHGRRCRFGRSICDFDFGAAVRILTLIQLEQSWCHRIMFRQQNETHSGNPELGWDSNRADFGP